MSFCNVELLQCFLFVQYKQTRSRYQPNQSPSLPHSLQTHTSMGKLINASIPTISTWTLGVLFIISSLLQPLRPQDPLPLPLVHLSTNTDISDETSIANLDSSYFSQWSPQTLFSFVLILGGLSSSSSDFPATNLLWLVAIFYPSSLLFLLSFSSCLLTLQEH